MWNNFKNFGLIFSNIELEGKKIFFKITERNSFKAQWSKLNKIQSCRVNSNKNKVWGPLRNNIKDVKSSLVIIKLEWSNWNKCKD